MKKNNIYIHLTLLCIGLLYYFVANFQRIAVPGAIFDVLGNELHISAPYITAFGAIYMYIYALGQLIIGILVDRYGGYRVMLAGAVILTAGCILFPISNILAVMYIARALIGLGSSCFYLSLIKELRNIFDEKQFGMAISVMLFIGYAGGIFANAPFVAAMNYMSWQKILLITGIICAVSLMAFIAVFKIIEPEKVHQNVKIRLLPFRLVLHKRHNRNLFSFACCNYGISYVIQAVIGKKFLEDFCIISSQKAACYLSIFAVVAAVFNLINAFVCKLCHNQRVKFLKCASFITLFSLLIVCLLILFNVRTLFIVFIFVILSANASLSSLLVPVLHMTNHKMTSGTAVSIMNFCFFMMVGILGTLTGFLLNIFEPIKRGNCIVYTNHAYLLVFGLFFLLSLFEVYKAMKLSNKY